MWLSYKLAKPSYDFGAPAASNKGRLSPATRDHESYSWLVTLHVRYYDIMTQYEAKLNATTNVNSNGIKFSLAAAIFKHTQPKFLSRSDELSNPLKKPGKFIILYVLVFIFLEMKARRQTILHGMIESLP